MRFVCPGDAEWPGQLDDLGDARPLGLWVRGRPSLRMWALRSVAVVGARACTEYGAHMAATLAAGLAERGWVVVSGGAYGVDGAAHRGALGAGGATVAVLACGVDRPYPRGHTAVDQQDRRTGSGRRGVAAGRASDAEPVHPAEPGDRRAHPRHRGRRGRPPQRLPGHGAGGTAAGPLTRWECRARPPADSRPACTNCCAGEAVLVTDAAEVVELVGDMGELAPDRRGPVLPRDLLDPRRAAGSRRAARRGAAAAADEIARGARHDRRTTRSARLYELRALGLRRTTRRRLEVDTPGDDLRPPGRRRC